MISVTSLKVACSFEDLNHVFRFPFTRDVDKLLSRMHCTSHIQRGVHGRSAFTHLYLLPQLFLQPQQTSFLQLTAAVGRVVLCGFIFPSLSKIHPQSVGSGSTGFAMVVGALHMPFKSVVGGWKSSQSSPFVRQQEFQASLT